MKKDGIKLIEPNTNLAQGYLKMAENSIGTMNRERKYNLMFAISACYYSMYYSLYAICMKIGYKIGSKISHKVTADALIIFIRNKLKKNLIEDYEKAKEEALNLIERKTDEIISSFDRELEKRSIFQYESTEEIKEQKLKPLLKEQKSLLLKWKKYYQCGCRC